MSRTGKHDASSVSARAGDSRSPSDSEHPHPAEAGLDPLEKVGEAHYLLALQSLYSEIFLIDVKNDIVYPLYHNTAHVECGTPQTGFLNFFRTRAETLVDPQYRDVFLASYAPEQLSTLIAENRVEEIEYRKRKNPGGPFRWFSSIIQPLPDHSGALLFLRDITRIKEAENNFFNALATNYGEIYILNPAEDSLRSISSFTHESPLIPTGVSFTKAIQHLAQQTVHPDDKASFTHFFAIPNLLRNKAQQCQAACEYRIQSAEHEADGSWRWLETRMLPMPGARTDELLVLSQDITARKQQEQSQRQMERRYNAVFRQSCDALLEIDLEGDAVTPFCFSNLLTNLSSSHHPFTVYSEFYEHFIKTCVHPEDVDALLEKRSIATLRRAFGADQNDMPARYRAKVGAEYCWLESRILFLCDNDKPLAFSVLRDITAQKCLEDTRNQERERLSSALRDTYTEICQLDLVNETSRIVFTSRRITRIDEENESYKWSDFIQAIVHPADRAHVSRFYSGLKLRALFDSGATDASEEYRLLGADGKYCWISSTLMPMRDEDDAPVTRAMLFVKDISQRKERDEQRLVIEQYSLALRNIYDIFIEINLTSGTYRIIHYAINKYVFPAARGSLGGFLAVDSRRLIHPEDQSRFRTFFDRSNLRERLAEANGPCIGEFRTLQVAGEYQWTSYTALPLHGGAGADETCLVFGANIHAHRMAEEMTNRNRLLEQRRVADERYKIIVEQTSTMIFEYKPAEQHRYISPELALRFAGTYDGRDPVEVWRQDGVVHSEDMPLFTSFADDGNARREVTVRLLQRSGVYLWCRISITAVTDENGALQHKLGTLNDVDEATRAALALRHKAERDPLTGLYNMRTFYANAERLLRESEGREYSIIRIDIDEFKVINELYGMDEGDLLLRKVARFLQNLMNSKSVCGRISGDVFCACVDLDTEGILEIVRHICDMLARYPLPSRVLPSFGICRVDNPATPINLLCDWAHLAQKHVKGNAVTFHAFYDDTLRQAILKEKSIESQMHSALDLGQFQLYLQPKVHIPTGRIIGAEGLVRWLHPTEGIIPPEKFIPLFEKNGFIIRMDEYIWEQTCKMLRRWLDEGRTPLPVSVNVSRMHIHDTRLRDKILGLTSKYDLPSHLLELELTENIFLDSKNQSFEAINALRGLGFRFSLDDFGAGYSSLNILKNLPVETLKIDRGFLDEVVATERGKTIIRCIIELAKSIDMQVVAEGVETAEQASFLSQTGCSIAQGFHYSQALPIDEFERLAFSKAQNNYPKYPQ